MATECGIPYQIGAKSRAGRGIHFIYGQSRSCGVYRDEHGFVHAETLSEESTPPEAAANRRFDELMASAQEFLPSRSCAAILERLAFCLYSGMTSSDEAAAVACFAPAERAIDRAVALRTRLWYLGPATALGVLLAAVFLWFWIRSPDVVTPTILVGALGGVAGAWTSILQRISKLSPASSVESIFSYSLQGGTRTMLGCVFGLVAIAAVAANILLGIANTSLAATSVVAFLAGFSERFVPELLQQVEDGVLKRPATA